MARASELKITDVQRQVCYGTLLGDASIGFCGGKNARIQMNHGFRQRYYAYWKYKQLKSICTRKSFSYRKPDKGSYSKHCKVRLQTRVSPDLTEINNLIKVNGKKTVSRSYLDLLDPLAIAVWWCDDGSITGGYRQGTLCTHSMTLEEVEICQQYFVEQWDIHPRIMTVTPREPQVLNQTTLIPNQQIIVCSQESLDPTKEIRKKPYYALNFHTVNAEKLIKLIIAFLPIKQMIYKTFLKFNNSKDTARWRSFLASHYVPRFFSSIEEFDVYVETYWQNIRSR
uniref:Putative site-specific DNA endonuclease n=1 Tax=Stigeoclonium sp. FACHB-2430 TaxID=2725788 RepID=A0A6H1U5E8_9CHLO|nr:putative site-specific DNA endonuclease [Stigeoclonium sp. FACHB-2430]